MENNVKYEIKDLNQQYKAIDKSNSLELNTNFYKELSLKNCLKNKNLFWNNGLDENNLNINLEALSLLEKIKISREMLSETLNFMSESKVNLIKSNFIVDSSVEFITTNTEIKIFDKNLIKKNGLTYTNVKTIKEINFNNISNTNLKESNILVISKNVNESFSIIKETLKDFTNSFFIHKKDITDYKNESNFIDLNQIINNQNDLKDSIYKYGNLVSEGVSNFIHNNSNINFLERTYSAEILIFINTLTISLFQV